MGKKTLKDRKIKLENAELDGRHDRTPSLWTEGRQAAVKMLEGRVDAKAQEVPDDPEEV